MKKTSNKKTRLIIALNIFLVLLNYTIVFIAKKYPYLIEKYYSRKLFYTISKPLSFISNSFKFSLGEGLSFIMGAFLIILVIKSIYNLIKKEYSKTIVNLLIIVLFLVSIVTYYQLAWGLNNYRVSVEENFNLENEDINMQDLAASYKYLVLESNNLKNRLLKNNNVGVSKEYIYKNVYKGFENLNDEYPFISADKTIVKPLKISKIFSNSGYAGIFIPFLSEANINYMMPKFSTPFTASHEIAHKKGFASEDSANFVGFLACYSHSDNYFKYSAFHAMMNYVGNSLYQNDKELYREIAALRSQEVLEDIETNIAFWEKHEKEKSKEVHNKINDSFLKANNQPQGLVTYSKVTELFVKAHKAGMFN
nr:DUF3810 domain-containing protein [Tissierella sp.]